jgi:hypothetical protein
VSVDNGSTFASKVVQAAVELMGAQVQHAGAYYNERLIKLMHRVINERIPKLRSRKQTDQGLIQATVYVSVGPILYPLQSAKQKPNKTA